MPASYFADCGDLLIPVILWVLGGFMLGSYGF